MRQIREIIAGKKCIIYADEQPQVMLIQPVGEHEEATLDAEIEAIKEAVQVPFIFAGFAISDWEEELTPQFANEMKKILFLHGFYASGQCVPAVALREEE